MTAMARFLAALPAEILAHVEVCEGAFHSLARWGEVAVFVSRSGHVIFFDGPCRRDTHIDRLLAC